MTLIRIPPHSDFEQGTGHFHDEQEEVYIVTRGTLTMRFGDDIRPVGAPARSCAWRPRRRARTATRATSRSSCGRSRRGSASGDATKIDDFWEASPDAAQAR